MQHLEEGTIHAWLDGALAPDEAERSARHASSCAECAAMVADARGVIAGASRIVSSLDVVRGGVIPNAASTAPAHSRSLWRVLHLTPARSAIAAALLVAVASTMVLSRRGGPSVLIEATAAATAPAPIVQPQPVKPSAVAKEGGPSTAALRASARDDKRASARDDKPAKPRQLALSEVVVTGVSDTTAKATDSTAAVKASALAGRGVAGGVARGVAAPRAAPAAQATSDMSAPSSLFAQGSVSLEGCYRIIADSSALPLGVPRQFSLERDSSSGANVVRIPSASGRADSLLAGAQWRQVANTATATLVTEQNIPLTIQLESTSPRARVVSGGETRDVDVQRVSCSSRDRQ